MWEKSDSIRIPLNYLFYIFQSVNGTECDDPTVRSSMNTTNKYWVLDGLLPGRNYDVWVYARNDFGSGRLSTVSVVTGEFSQLLEYFQVASK